MITLKGITPETTGTTRIDAVSYKRTETILIVEDEEDLRRSLGIRLESVGFIVDTAVDGTEGMQKLQLARPDLLALDLCLPGMSGESPAPVHVPITV